jgi:hypothetical protein
MSKEELHASGAVDEDGKPIIDPENNMKTPEQGAATSVWCAVSSQLDGKGGVYCENIDIAKAVGADSKELLGARPWAIRGGRVVEQVGVRRNRVAKSNRHGPWPQTAQRFYRCRIAAEPFLDELSIFLDGLVTHHGLIHGILSTGRERRVRSTRRILGG